MSLAVVIQAMPDRPELEVMRRELELSDIGTDYEVMFQPPDLDPKVHFINVLKRLSEADTEYVLRLEDDCFKVNSHIKHNLLTWRALKDWKFGVGWGFRPGGSLPANKEWHKGRYHASLCTIFRRDMLPEIIRGCEKWFEFDKSPLPQDIAITMAVYEMGKQTAIHGPSLVENNIHAKSTLDHLNRPEHTSGGTFNREWRRRI